MAEFIWDLEYRAGVHRALGDQRRLQIVDELQLSDRSVSALAELTGLASNLLAFHLGVLDDAGVVTRTVSEGDARRRYVALDPDVLPVLGDPPPLRLPSERVLFVCTANTARSQLAAGLWQARTGRPALSGGTQPAERVHPSAVEVAARHGLDLTGNSPTDLRSLDLHPDLVVSVCDRAHESMHELDAPRLHWSVPDPVPKGAAAFEHAFTQLTLRIDRLARAARAA